MGKRRIPPEAFEYYASLGVDRSYQQVAEHFGVSKTAVVNLAVREGWQDKVRQIDDEVREKAREQAKATLEQIHERQLKSARALQKRALEVLMTQPPEKAIRAASALNVAWKHELFLIGEPTERTEVDLWEKVKREQERWLVNVDDDEEPVTDADAAS